MSELGIRNQNFHTRRKGISYVPPAGTAPAVNPAFHMGRVKAPAPIAAPQAPEQAVKKATPAPAPVAAPVEAPKKKKDGVK